MQHRQVDRALDVEAEVAVGQQPAQHIPAAGLLPQPPEHQVRADAGAAQLGQLAAVEARQHDGAARVAGGRGDQRVERARGLDLVAPAERLDDALDVAAALAGVLHQVEVLIAVDLLDPDEHGAAPCSRKDTTVLPHFSNQDAAFTMAI